MKYKKAIVGILNLSLVFLYGCFGETNCPGFSREYLNWMPYSRYNYIRFSNGIDTIRFVIEDAFYSEPYSFKNNCKCDCGASAYFTSCITNEIDLQIEGNTYYGSSLEINYEYKFIKHGYLGNYYVAESSDDFFFSKENGEVSNEIIPEFTVNNVVYDNVIKLELDTIDDNSLNWRKPNIWRTFIADSVGIIQFELCETGVIWRIINK